MCYRVTAGGVRPHWHGRSVRAHLPHDSEAEQQLAVLGQRLGRDRPNTGVVR